MAYLGNQPAAGENNSFKILDDISSYTLTFDGSSSSVVSTSDNTITENAHRFITGQRVTYTNGSGTDIGGLTDGNPYYIIKSDQNTIKLAASASDAINDVAISLSAVGTGSDHTLNVAFDSVNTKFKATYNNGTKAKMTRAAQLTISVNGVIQQPQDTSSPTNGFGFDLDSVIVFSTAPASTDAFWGHIVANNFASFDISDNTVDSFTGDNVTTDFTLSKSPANNQNVLVTLDGVVQYPSDATTTKAYSISENVISFASAPGLGVAIQVRHIGFAGATSSAVTGFYGRTGNVTFKDTDSLTVANIVASSGLSTFSDLVVTGDLTVQGTTTTLDTLVTEVDKLEVAASNTNVAVAVTQSSTGDILRLYDGSTQVVTVADGGYVGIGTDNPTAPLHISGADAANTKIKLEDNDNGFAASEINVANGGRDLRIAAPQDIYFEDLDTNTKTLYIKDGGNIGIGTDNPGTNLDVAGNIRLSAPDANIQLNDGGPRLRVPTSNTLTIHTGGNLGTGDYERLRITSSGSVGIGTDNPTETLHVVGDLRVTGIITSGTGTITIDGVNNQITIGSGSSQVKFGGGLEYPSIRPTLDLNFAATKTLDRRITFTRDSLGTYVDELGIVRTAPNNTPRFDHDPTTGESLGLLIEDSRTNYTYNSLNYSGSWTSNRGTFTGITTVTSPDGTTDGVVLFTETTETGAHHIKAPENTPTETIADGTTVTSSIWVKKYGSKQYITFGINLKDDSYARTTVDLDTGAVSNTAANYTATSTAYPNGWYRITVTGDGGTGSGRTAPVNSLFLVQNGSSTVSSYTGDGSSGVYVWGPQMEIGSFATSFIPTTDANTVTRAAEIASITGTNFTGFYNGTEGTVFSEIRPMNLGEPTGTGHVYWSFNQVGGFGEGIYFSNSSGAQSASGYLVQDNSASQVTGVSASNLNDGVDFKTAFVYKENDYISATNGTLGNADDNATVPTNERLVIGNNAWGGSNPSNNSNSANAHFKSFKYYNKRLPNAQLQGLTAQ